MESKKVGVQDSDIQGQADNEKVNAAMSLYGDAVTSQNIEGEGASEQGKRSAPPEVPPAKEIAKPPIDEDSQDSAVRRKVEPDQEAVKQEVEMNVTSAVKKEPEVDGLMQGKEDGQNQLDDEDERQVDVDLGALKSVSRLHARIG